MATPGRSASGMWRNSSEGQSQGQRAEHHGRRRPEHRAQDLEPARERLVGVLGGLGHVLVVGMHPQLAPGAVDDRRGLAVVVGVGVRADDELHVLHAQVDLRHRPLQVGEGSGLVHAGVEHQHTVTGVDSEAHHRHVANHAV